MLHQILFHLGMLNSRPANILLDANGTPKMADFGLLLSWKSWVRGRFVLWCHLFHGSGLKTKALQQL